MKEYNIYIIEDDAFYRELLKDYFKKFVNAHIRTFQSGEEYLSNRDGKADIIIIDYYLDKEDISAMNGQALYNKIKAQGSEARVIIISSQEDASIVFELVKNGIRDYVIKDQNVFKEMDSILSEFELVPRQHQ